MNYTYIVFVFNEWGPFIIFDLIPFFRKFIIYVYVCVYVYIYI